MTAELVLTFHFMFIAASSALRPEPGVFVPKLLSNDRLRGLHLALCCTERAWDLGQAPVLV